MTKTLTNAAAAVFMILGIAVVYVLLSLFYGLVLKDLWRWFIVPVFALPTITYLQAVGISLVVGFFKLGLASSSVNDDYEGGMAVIAPFAKSLIAGLLTWGISALWAQFIL